jgi:membrane protein implicated in regulation of membrane protease activity
MHDNHHDHVQYLLAAMGSAALAVPAWLELVAGWLKIFSLFLSCIIAIWTLVRMYKNKHYKSK